MGILLVAISLTGALIGGAVLAEVKSPPRNAERVIKVVAQRFRYSPNEIVLKKGQPAVIEFTALDFQHGFKIPDLSIRADLPPGKVTRIQLTPDRVGVYDFLCDNFCGGGHEEMNGRIIVTN
jgi:cytochrome c oxidase subunit II